MADKVHSRNLPKIVQQIPKLQVTFDAIAFDDVNIRANGVTFIHYAAIPCPLGLNDPDDIHSHTGHPDCDNGSIYVCQGEVTGNFSGNSNNANLDSSGYLDQSRAYATFPRFYDDKPTKQVLVSTFDKFEIKGNPVRVPNGERLEHHQSGVDRLQYPAACIDFVIDSRGTKYTQGTDFDLVNGHISWLPGRSPGYNPVLGVGVVFSVRYTYIPWWYCGGILHEVRLARIPNAGTGKTELTRMPYQVALDREYTFQKTNAERKLKENAPAITAVQQPASGGYGPR